MTGHHRTPQQTLLDLISVFLERDQFRFRFIRGLCFHVSLPNDGMKELSRMNWCFLNKGQEEPVGMIDSRHWPHFCFLGDLNPPYLSTTSLVLALQNIPSPPHSHPVHFLLSSTMFCSSFETKERSTMQNLGTPRDVSAQITFNKI